MGTRRSESILSRNGIDNATADPLDTIEAAIEAMNSDHWKLKVHEGFLAVQAADGSLLPGALRVFNPPTIDGRPDRTAHLSFSKHILAETWETRFVPGFKGNRTGS